MQFVVARYLPPGNNLRSFEDNVHPSGSSNTGSANNNNSSGNRGDNSNRGNNNSNNRGNNNNSNTDRGPKVSGTQSMYIFSFIFI